ncbi:MAG: leucine-rich repeat domain-containing protein, partial [Rhodospirillales bacterium]|nr:leucine-rich repeat domain-containing protein [Rhodospirillales bacterium]
MLAAVGLLLASLVLGQGTNLARALGDGDAGICKYTDVMRAAILANNGQTNTDFDCDDEYGGVGPFWGGSKGTAGTPAAQDGHKDLDLKNKGISTFMPDKGELDGFRNGSRVDLRGNGLTVADLDVSDALESWEDGTDDTTKFLDTVNGQGAGTGELTSPNVGLTFLLDGGSTSSNGLASATYSVTEGGIAWITFEYGDKPADFGNVNTNDGGVWALVTFEIEHDRATGDEGSDVSILINSNDPDDVLYAVPFKFPDDIVIEKDEDFDIENVRLVGVGTHAQALTPTFATRTVDGQTIDFTANEFADSLVRDGDEAEITVIDNDTPPVLVSDRDEDVSDAIAALFALVNGASKSKKKMSIGDLELLTNDATNSNTQTGGELTIGKNNATANDGEPISSISPTDLSGLTKLNKLDLSDNDLTELPSGLFAEVGSKNNKYRLSTEIDITGNDGPTGDGFFLSNLGPVGEELVAGQYLVVDTPKDDDSDSGFLDASYEGVEGKVLVFDINIKGTDAGSFAGIQFLKTTGDTGALTGNDDTDKDVESGMIDISALTAGQYRIAIGLPENKKESGDNTLTAFFGHRGSAADTDLQSILSVAPVTIRDASYEAPEAPTMPESSFESVV